MFNLNHSVTVIGRDVVSVDPDTGHPVYADSAIMNNQPCQFGVISAADHDQSWGDGATPTNTDKVTAALRLPSWAPDLSGEDLYAVSVSGFPAITWRVRAKRPGERWDTYLVQAS